MCRLSLSERGKTQMSENKMKIGATCALNASPNAPFPIITSDLYEAADWMSKNGFDSIEYHIRDPKEVDGRKLKDYTDEKGLIVSSIGTGMAYGMEGLSISSTDNTVRKNAIQRLKDQVDLGAVLGGYIIIGSIRGVIGPDNTFEQVDKLNVESMKELADYAEKKNVYFAIEAIDRFETDYIQTAQETLDLIDRIGSSHVTVHLDSYHMNIEESDWVQPILACGDKLGHFHVADNNRDYPGWGHIPFPTIIEALKKIGYHNSLTMECYPHPDGHTAALKGRDYLRSIL